MKTRLVALLAVLGLTTGLDMGAARAADDQAKPIRVGMIGLDTSHVPAFVKIFNNAPAGSALEGIKVVAGYPGGTDFAPSKNRVAKFTEDLRKMDIEIVDTIPKLLEKVDVVLLESVDGRIHLEEAAQVIKAGKPLFIDKPVAGSLVDAIAIDDLAKEHNVPYFSSSSSRFGPGLQALKHGDDVGTLAGAAVWGPCSYQPDTPDLTFYGVHGIEALVNLMGTGCETVSRIQAKDADLVTCVWKGGRVGTYRGIRQNKAAFGAIAFGTKGIVQAKQWGDYKDLCNEIASFFKTRKPPFSSAETLEIMAIIEAADQSRDQGGASVSLADVVSKARAELAAKKQK